MLNLVLRRLNIEGFAQVRRQLYPAQNLNCVRTFKNFGHGRETVPGVTIAWHSFLICSLLFCFIDFQKIKKMVWDKEPIEKRPQRRY